MFYVPFSPSNYDYFDTVNNEHFYVRKITEGTVEFNLYKNSAEPHRVDKTNYLELVNTIGGVFRESTSITEITVSIEYPTFIDFNYVYIPTFNRYYFVTDIRVQNYNLYEIDLSVDVLMSYKDAIANLEGFIDRNERYWDGTIIDKKRAIGQGVDISTFQLDNSLFPPDGSIIDDTTSYINLNNDYMYVLVGYKIGVASTET